MSDRLVAEMTIDEIVAERDAAEEARAANLEAINNCRRHNTRLESDIAFLTAELLKRAREGRLRDAAFTSPVVEASPVEEAPPQGKAEATPAKETVTSITSRQRKMCCYCGVKASRFNKLEPDGPGKFSCINSETCDDRIRKANAVM